MPSAEFQKSLVLVVGAGASKEANLPIGSELKHQIASVLNIRFESGARISGDARITQALRIAASQDNGLSKNINDFLHAGWMIRDAMPQAASIDNFIDAHRDNPLIEKCGKLAIARCILDAESSSTLRVDPRNINDKLNFKATESTWFNIFFRLLVEGCQRADIPDRLSRVAVITFNYDRCIEHYFHASLRNYYGLGIPDATEAMSNLKIYHPYGSIGSLPWRKPVGGIEFGATPEPNELLVIADQLKTFTEGTDESHSDIVAIRKTLRSAERVAFLGFAFNSQNLQLLYGGSDQSTIARQCPVFGTAIGLSKSDIQIITNELAKLGGHPIDQVHLGQDLNCANLIKEYWRNLSVR